MGDLDGDGVTDLAVGAYHDDSGGSNRGAVHVLLLNANGTVKSRIKIASGTSGGPTLADGDLFGVSVASPGDLDGDGVTDLVVGANHDDTGGARRGAVYVLLLNASGTVKSSMKIANGVGGGPALAADNRFGASLGTVGDLDGDGVTDLAVGARFDDAGGADRAAFYILLLTTNGSVKSSVKIANGLSGGPTLADGDSFGCSVASLGDVNGDGVTDLIVGAKDDDTGGTARGAVHVLFLKLLNQSPTRIDDAAVLTPVAEDTAGPAGSSVATLLSSVFADADGTTIATGGVAIVANAATAAQGTWQVQVPASGSANLPTNLDSTAAIVLRADDLIRFVPAPDFNGLVGALTVRLWDGTGGFTSSLKLQNISVSIGGSGAFSNNDNQVTLGTGIATVNDPPVGVADLLPSVAEDSGARTIFFSTLLDNDSAGPANESGQTLTITQVSGAVGGTVSIAETNVIFTPLADFSGPATFTYTLQDNGTTNGAADFKTSSALVTFVIGAVNQAPSFTKGADQAATDESPAQTASGWATGISAGPPSESGQALRFEVTNNNNGLFLTQPAIDATGKLTLTPQPNTLGSAQVTVVLKDDGGTANGGSDSSSPQTFNLTITKPHRWHNALSLAALKSGRLDVNFDGAISPIDAVLFINYFNADRPAAIPANARVGGPPPAVAAPGQAQFLDTGGGGLSGNEPDNFVSAIDAVLVINELNATTANFEGAIPASDNDPPLSAGESYSTLQDSPLNVIAPGVLANDGDFNGDALTAVLATPPLHGTLALNADGGFIYTPDRDYSGPDSFAYRASDGQSTSNQGTVSLVVNSVPDNSVAARLLKDINTRVTEQVQLNGPAVDLNGQRPISIAMRWAGIAEENLAGSFVTKAFPGTLVERLYGLHEFLL